jgi:L-lactate dehydrogenase
VGGRNVGEIVAERDIRLDDFQRAVEQDVRYANISIIEGIGASQYGIGLVTARLAEAIAADERAVFPVGSHIARFGIALSLPGVVGRHGVVEVITPDMSETEMRALERSAEKLRDALAKYRTTG